MSKSLVLQVLKKVITQWLQLFYFFSVSLFF
jgi:hypothetical protein